MTVDILCRVVDNLGDIGFVYRLARALSEPRDAPRLRLIVDDLAAFAGLCPGIDSNAALQTVEGFTVVRWDNPGEDAVNLFLGERPRMVLECYACGRPEWLESILFDTSDPVPRWIINLEYLTAESWARDFHKLPSLTRSPLVRKTVFMPGLEAGTGGLIQDRAFCAVREACTTPEGKLSVRRDFLRLLPDSSGNNRHLSDRGHLENRALPEAAFWVLIFSYEHDFSTIVSDLAAFNATRPVLVLVAAGRCSALFLEAWNQAGRPFPVLALPLLPQKQWDSVLLAADFTIVRGEESFSRAVLSGHPFLWQCYPFGLNDGSGDQLPKVHAFLERIKPFLDPEDFAAYERLTLRFNRAGAEPGEILQEIEGGALLAILQANRSFSVSFAVLSQEVRNLGNLAANLLTFMHDLG